MDLLTEARYRSASRAKLGRSVRPASFWPRSRNYFPVTSPDPIEGGICTVPTPRAIDPRPRRLTCRECDRPFEAPRIGRPPPHCPTDRCRKAAEARRQREYRRSLVRDREELAALRSVLREVAAA